MSDLGEKVEKGENEERCIIGTAVRFRCVVKAPGSAGEEVEAVGWGIWNYS